MKAGFAKEDDRQPKFFYEEALPSHNTVFAISGEEMDGTFDFWSADYADSSNSG